MIVITIGYLNDMRDATRGEQILETRLWIHQSAGWIGAQYIWNDAVTDAGLSLAGGRAEVSWIHSDGERRTHTFAIPNTNQC